MRKIATTGIWKVEKRLDHVLKIIAYFAQKVYFIERENADDDGQIINEIKRGQIPSAQYV